MRNILTTTFITLGLAACGIKDKGSGLSGASVEWNENEDKTSANSIPENFRSLPEVRGNAEFFIELGPNSLDFVLIKRITENNNSVAIASYKVMDNSVDSNRLRILTLDKKPVFSTIHSNSSSIVEKNRLADFESYVRPFGLFEKEEYSVGYSPELASTYFETILSSEMQNPDSIAGDFLVHFETDQTLATVKHDHDHSEDSHSEDAHSDQIQPLASSSQMCAYLGQNSIIKERTGLHCFDVQAIVSGN